MKKLLVIKAKQNPNNNKNILQKKLEIQMKKMLKTK